MVPGRAAVIAILASVASLAIGLAEASNLGDGPPCERYAWPLDAEAMLIRQPAGDVKASLDARWNTGVGGAIRLILQDEEEARFVQSPEREPKREHWYGGVVTVSALTKGGVYQISLSSAAWIDVIQADRIVPSVDFTGEAGCPVHKSVRYRLDAAPITIQVSDAEEAELVVVLTEARD